MSALTPIPTRAGVTPKPTPRDPAAVVQRAWSILRLTRLQELVRLTIAELESFPQPEPIILGPATRVMSLRDGTKKMSKSDPSDLSRINLTDDADTIGANSDEDCYIDDFKQLDFSASYRFRKDWEVFGEITNITNEPFRVYFNSSNGQGRRFVQFEEYDVTVNVGLRWKL